MSILEDVLDSVADSQIMYDHRLAQYDKPELVYSETHAKGKENARWHITRAREIIKELDLCQDRSEVKEKIVLRGFEG